MTEVDVDKVFAELKQTTVGYAKLSKKPPTDKNSHWYKALLELGVIEGTPPPPPPPPPPPGSGQGAQLRAFLPPLTSPQITKDLDIKTMLKIDGQVNRRYQNVTATGPIPTGHPVWILGGSKGIELVNWNIHDVFWQHNTSTSSMPDLRAQGFTIHESQNIRVASSRVERLGGVQWDHFMYAHDFDRLLFEGVLGYKIGAYGFHLYGGPGKDFVAANFTMGYCGRSGATHSDAGLTGTIRYVNGIFHNIPEYGVRHNEGSAEVIVENCWAWKCGKGLVGGTQASKVKVIGGGTLTESPFVNEAAGDFRIKPDHPLATGAKPEWMAAADAYGNPYTRPTVGGVAS